MNRRICWVVGLAAFALVVAACGDDTAESGNTSTSAGATTSTSTGATTSTSAGATTSTSTGGTTSTSTGATTSTSTGGTTSTSTGGTTSTSTGATTSTSTGGTTSTSTGATTSTSTSTTSTTAAGGEFEIDISGSAFQPANATVSKGTTVRWRNRDGFPHTTTSNDGVWTASLSADERFSFTFNTPGTYTYICSIHPSMTGTITVTE